LVSRRAIAGASREWRRDGLGGFDLAKRGQGRLERDFQHLVHSLDEMQLHGIAEVFGNLGYVFLVVLGQNHFEKAGAMGGEEFFFQSSDRQNLATQSDFASHGQVAANGDLAKGAGNCRGDGDAGRRTVFRNRALGNVHMQVEIAVEVAIQAEAVSAGTHVGHGSLRGLLHHVAEFSGKRELALAVYYRGLSTENRAADLCPGQAGDQTDFTLLVSQSVAELDDAEEVVDVFAGDRDGVVGALFDYLARDLAADIADFAFEIAYAGFASVGADEPPDGVVGEFDVLFRKARGQHLLLDQKLLRDLNLFLLGVAMQAQHLHAVLQGRRNGVHHVGGGHEEDL